MTTPVVTMNSPAGLAPADVMDFHVTDAGTLGRVMVIVQLASGWEVAHDGDVFGPGYEASSRTSITGGFAYLVRRRAGWLPGPMHLKVIATDAAGTEA